jgi:hypothetical protein
LGYTIRHAIALGLHLGVADVVDLAQQQVRSRTWWSLYSLEQLLSDFVGRPTSIPASEVAIPLELANPAGSLLDIPPLPTTTRQVLPGQPPAYVDPLTGILSASHQYFVWHVRLTVLGHRIRSSLYSSGLAKETWSDVQQGIRELDQDLNQWSADLPEGLRLPQWIDMQSHEQGGVGASSSGAGGAQFLDRFEMALSYQSSRMILFRPCLRHLAGVTSGASALSQSFDQDAAVSCVTAARCMLALLPPDASTGHSSRMLPWWTLLHYLNQAGAVLILELCLKAEHMPTQAEELLDEISRMMEWLAEMAADSLSAWRSWHIFRRLSVQAAAGVGVEFAIPWDVPKPSGYKAVYEQLCASSVNDWQQQ